MAKRDARSADSAPSVERRNWLTVSQAAKLLGVGSATVRRWTSSGRLKAFVTPGGHRRYQAADLAEMVAAGGGARPDLTADELGALWSARERSAAAGSRHEGWRAALSEDDLAMFRRSGRELIKLAAEYVIDTDRRAAIAVEVEPLAVEYGQQAARAGVSLGQLMEAFSHFRRPLFEAVDNGDDEDSPLARRVAEDMSAALLDLAEFVDLFTVRMVEAYVASVLGPLTSRLSVAGGR